MTRRAVPPAGAQPPVVAELGRPETPEELRDRKAESSRVHRESQTLTNLVFALIASLAIVLVIVLVVVRPDAPPPEPIDYQSIAAEAGSTTPLAAPQLPSGWIANAATFNARPADGVVTWYVGFITPKQQFVALRQGIDANPTWVANQLAARSTTGTTTIAGITWKLYDHRTVANVGNLAYGMTTGNATSSYILFGTASDAEFETIATELAPTIKDGQQ